MRDPDFQKLTHGASSANPEIVTTSVDDGTLTVTAVEVGITTVTATETDPGGLSATMDFQVTVTKSGPG